MERNGDTIKVMLTRENIQETEEVLAFLKMLDNKEKKDFLIFIRGARFTKLLEKEAV